MCLDWIFKHYKSYKSTAVEINTFELQNLIKAIAPDVDISAFDLNYRLPPFDVVIKFLKEDLTDKGVYIEDYKDCDDFSIILWGMWKAHFGAKYTAFGLLLTSRVVVLLLVPSITVTLWSRLFAT